MTDETRSKAELIAEVQTLRQRVAELEASQAALRRSEKKYRSLVEAADDVILLTDLEGTPLYRNSAYYTSLGYQPGEPMEEEGFARVHPDDRVALERNLQKLLIEGKMTSEYRVRHRNNNWILRFAKSVVLYDEANHPEAVLTTIRDITERKLIEQALRESEAKFRGLAETTAAATVIFSEKFLYANPATEAITGYSQFELQKMSFWELVHPDFQEMARENGLAFQKGEVSQTEYEVKILTQSREPRWVYFSGGLIDFAGQSAIIGTAFDITDRKRTEDALEKMNQRYRTLFDEAPAMYVITRTQNNRPIIVDANEQFLTTLDYSWSEVSGQSITTFYSAKSGKRLLEGGHERALRGEFTAEERDLVTREGRVIQTLLRASPETDGSGQVIGTRAMYIDITESKQLQERLAAIHQLGRELTLLRNEEEIIRQALKTTQLVLRCDYTACGLIDPTTNHLVYSHHPKDGGWLELHLPLDGPDPRGITVTAAKDGYGINVPDVRQDPRYINAHPKWDSYSELCVPMKIGERIIGVLDAESKQLHHFTADDQRILQILADQTAVALENAWLHVETEWRAKELVALNKAGQAMAASLEINRVMEQALAEVKELLTAEGVSLLLLDPATDELEFAAAASPSAEAMIGLRLPLSDGIAGWAATRRESILIEDAQQEERFYKSVDAATGLTTRSLIAVPLLFKGRLVGVIESINKAEGAFTERDLELLEALAGSAVIAIENARLHTETQQRLRAQTALRETALAISSTLDLDTVLYRVAEQMCGLVNVTSAYISRYEAAIPAVLPIAEYISPEAHRREKEADLGVIYTLKKDFDELVTALESGQHLVTHIDDPDISSARRQYLQQYGAKTVLDIPMRVGGRTIACATLWESRHRRDFSFEEINLCYDLAQHAAIAMENAHLHTETQQRLEAQTALRQAVAAIFSTLELETVLSQIATQIGRAINATRTCICSYEAKALRSEVLAEYIGPQAGAKEQRSNLDAVQPLSQDPREVERLRSGQIWITHIDDPDLGPTAETQLKNFGAKSVLTLPLKVRGQVIAYAKIWESRRKRQFTTTEIVLCQDISQQAVVALENARLHEETERRANQLSVLHELDQAITASLNIQDIYEAFARHAIRLTPYDRMSILRLEEEEIRLVYVTGERRSIPAINSVLPTVGAATRYVLSKGKALLWQENVQEPDFLEDDQMKGSNICSGLILPLRSKGNIIGTWNIGSYQTNFYNQDDLQIAQSMADQLAIAIENIHLFEAEKIQRQRTEALQAAGAAISSTLNLNQVLDQLLVELGRVVPYDSASVFLLEEDHLRITIARSLPNPSPIGQRFEPNELAKLVEETRRPLILADARRDPRFQRWEGAQHVQGWMNVPLIARDAFIGHITLDSRQSGAFTQTDADLAMSFANQAAMAVENARLFQHLQKQMHILEETQGQLVQSESMAALGRLSASIAHEINNPLQAIQSGLLLFKEKVDRDLQDDKLMNYLEIAEQEIDRISAIMHRMRNFYPAAGKTQPTSPPTLDLLDNFYRSAQQDLQSVDLQVMLKSALKLIEKHIEQKSITLQCDWPPGLPPVQGNADHLQQVFLNLMINALEAMADQGGVLILKSATDQIDVGEGQLLPAVRIEISDTGPGIPPDQVERLFEQFYSTKENGSGLGLFISRKIIEAHNGRITVESRPGLGTTFSVLLPIEQI